MDRPLRRGDYLTGFGAPTLPTNLPGDILFVAGLYNATDPTPTAPGWTVLPAVGAGIQLVVFYQESAGAVSALNPSANPEYGWVSLAVADAEHVDDSTLYSGSGQACTFGSLNPVGDSELVLDFVAGLAPPGLTDVQMPDSTRTSPDVGTRQRLILRAGELDLTAAGPTGTRSGSFNVDADWVTLSVVVR